MRPVTCVACFQLAGWLVIHNKEPISKVVTQSTSGGILSALIADVIRPEPILKTVNPHKLCLLGFCMILNHLATVGAHNYTQI